MPDGSLKDEQKKAFIDSVPTLPEPEEEQEDELIADEDEGEPKKEKEAARRTQRTGAFLSDPFELTYFYGHSLTPFH